LLVGEALGGSNGLLLALGLAAVMNFASYWWSDKLVLMMYRAEPLGPEHRFSRVVARLAQRAGLPMPRVYLIPSDAMNAFATGRDPRHAAVAATAGILRTLDERELEGVIGHELAHVKHRDILISSVAATIAAAIMTVARLGFLFGGSRDDDRGGGAAGALAMLILAPIAAVLVQAAISRAREYEADRGGAQIAGGPHGLVSALRKIEAAAHERPLDANPATAHMFILNPLSGRPLLSLFSTHPPTEQRINKLLDQ